jgi:hypothetical protein
MITPVADQAPCSWQGIDHQGGAEIKENKQSRDSFRFNQNLKEFNAPCDA